jgi:Na+/H+-dicarboxylate symporter
MIAVLFAVDTIPDMIEGTANVTGDMAAVAIVANYTEKIPIPEIEMKI